MIKINVAILGLGTVGQGVADLLTREKETLEKATGCEVVLKKCLEKFITKKFDVPIEPGVLTNRWQDILNDESIQIVIETIGGIEPARTYIMQALRAGKNVITANKDLLAACGQDLFKIAMENRRDLYYEASVGGAIPLIGPMRQSLSAGNLEEMVGIVNGTTNYILTKMASERKSFEDILQDAIDLGYAEADPSADIEGHDAARKMAILATLGFHTQVTLNDVYTEGISHITLSDIDAAKNFGYAIKLLGIARKENDVIEVRVHPTLVPNKHLLASVDNNMNCILVHGEEMGDSMFYGPGAGRYPAASAVLGDVGAIARNIRRNSVGRLNLLDKRELLIKPINEVETSFFLRMILEDQPGVLADITEILSSHEVSLARILQKPKGKEAELTLITHKVKDGNMSKAIADMAKLSATKEILTVLRVEEL